MNANGYVIVEHGLLDGARRPAAGGERAAVSGASLASADDFCHRLLEYRLAYLDTGQPRFIAVVAGPHPYMGGDLSNNVTAHLLAALALGGGAVLAFNYSGVGRSSGTDVEVARGMDQFWKTGQAPHDPQLADDTLQALRYAAALSPTALVAVGYSFGCWTLACCAACVPLRAVVLIAPTVGRHEYSALDAAAPPVCVISAAADFLVTDQAMDEWIAARRGVRRHRRLSGAEHFFRGQEAELAARSLEFILEMCA